MQDFSNLKDSGQSKSKASPVTLKSTKKKLVDGIFNLLVVLKTESDHITKNQLISGLKKAMNVFFKVKPECAEFQTLSCDSFIELYKGQNRIVTYKLNTINLYRVASIAAEGSAGIIELFHPDVLFEQEDMADLSCIQKYFSTQELTMILSSYLEGDDNVGEWFQKYSKNKDEHGFIKQLYKFLSKKQSKSSQPANTHFNFLVGKSNDTSKTKPTLEGSPVCYGPPSHSSGGRMESPETGRETTSPNELHSPGQRIRSPRSKLSPRHKQSPTNIKKLIPISTKLPTGDQLGPKCPLIVKGLLLTADSHHDSSYISLKTILSSCCSNPKTQTEELSKACAKYIKDKVGISSPKLAEILEGKFEPDFVKSFSMTGDLDSFIKSIRDFPGIMPNKDSMKPKNRILESPDVGLQGLSKKLQSMDFPRKQNWRRMMSTDFRTGRRGVKKRYTGRTNRNIEEDTDGLGFDDGESIIDSTGSSCLSNRPIPEIFQKKLCSAMSPRFKSFLDPPFNLVKARLGHLLSSQEMSNLEKLYIAVCLS